MMRILSSLIGGGLLALPCVLWAQPSVSRASSARGAQLSSACGRPPGAPSGPEGEGSAEEGAGPAEASAGSVEEGAGSAQASAGSAEEGAESAEASAGLAEETAGSAEASAGSAEEGAGLAQAVVRARRPRGEAGTAAAQRLRSDEAVVQLMQLGDLLEATLGAQVRHSGGVGRAQFMQLRGASAHQLSVRFEGIPLDSSRGGAFDLSTLPASFVEEALVLRGAAAGLYGSGAQGGVLLLQGQRPPKGHRVQAQLRAGSAGLAQVDAGYAQALARGHLLGQLSASRAEGDFSFVDVNGERRRRQNHQHQRVGGLVSGQLDLKEAGTLDALVEGVALQRGEPGIEQFERRADESAQHRLQLGLAWRRPQRSLPLEWRAQTWFRLRGYALSAPEPLYDGASYAAQRDHSAGAQAQVLYRSAQHRAGLAAEGRAEWVHTQTHRSDLGGERAQEAQRLSGALSASEQWTITPGLDLLGALRLDAQDRRDAVWLPQLGLRWRGAPIERALRCTLRANVGRLFRDPGLDELYFEGPGVRGNAQLRAEDGWGADLGAECASRWLSLELTGFEQRYDRVILFVPIDAWRLLAQDDLQAQVRGLEAAAQLAWGPVRAQLHYTRQWATQRGAYDLALPYRPAHHFFGLLSVALDRAQLYARVDARSASYADRFEARTLGAYTVADLGLRGPLPWAPQWGAGLEFRNLFDSQGLDIAQQPRPGRSWFLSLSGDWGG